MAFVVKDYGSGKLGNVTSVSTTVNSYARVTAATATTVTINTTTQITGDATFTAGAKVLLHVAATTSSSYKTYLGCYLLTTITNVAENVLTVEDNFTKVLPSSEFSRYYVQAIAVAEYRNLTLNSGNIITPPVFSASSYIGGVVAIMCSGTLTFNGGHISLSDRGIPVASKTLRPTTNNDVIKDTENYAGWENSDTHIHFMLNAGDGAAFIVAKSMVCNGTASRIGNVSTYGVQFYRGDSATSVTYNESAPSNVTNVGGSTILIAAETITNFTPRLIAKYRSSTLAAGQGICRCYIASETKLRNDEGLYAYDCISNPRRLVQKINFRGFGNGSAGDVTNYTGQLNNYATITAISGRKITYKNQTTAGLAQIAAGALVMIHWNHKNGTTVADAGRFILANVLSNNGSQLTIDADLPSISVSSYAAQIISIPQCNNFTLATTNAATAAFDGAQGGMCAIAVKNNCNLSSGIIDVKAKGGGAAYARNGLGVIGNAQDGDKLPIGQGHGSVFILAQNLTMNTNTKIGNANTGNNIRPYRGNNTSYTLAQQGSGANGGVAQYNGGYGGNGACVASDINDARRMQGAHIFILAQQITGFNQNAIGTSGGTNNFAGYGDNGWTKPSYLYGGYNGGGGGIDSRYAGGSAGWAFVYCNNAVSQSTDSTIRPN